MAKKRAVGLLVMTELNGELVAVLQRRGEFNHEKMGPESFPGACQLTVHGGLKDGEEVKQGLIREVAEELGEGFRFAVKNLCKLVHVFTEENENKSMISFATEMNAHCLKELELGPSSGGIRLLRQDEIDSIQDLKNFSKEEGVTDRRVIAMFPDSKEAIKKAFELFSNSR